MLWALLALPLRRGMRCCWWSAAGPIAAPSAVALTVAAAPRGPGGGRGAPAAAARPCAVPRRPADAGLHGRRALRCSWRHRRGRHLARRTGLQRGRVRRRRGARPLLRPDAALRREHARHRHRRHPPGAADGLGGHGRHLLGADRLLVAGHRDASGRADTAFLTTRTADLGLYLAAGAALAGGRVGTLAARRPARRAGGPVAVLRSAPGVVVAALGKSAQLPFSFWLSAGDARSESGLGPAALGDHGRRRRVPAAADGTAAGGVRLGRRRGRVDGCATALVLGLVALAQTDLKQLLAASSCAQIGFMVLAAGGGARSTGGTLQLVAHAAAKSLLFLAAGAWLTALGTQAAASTARRGRGRYRSLGAAVHRRRVHPGRAAAAVAVGDARTWCSRGALETRPWLYAAGWPAAVVSAGLQRQGVVVRVAPARWTPRPDSRAGTRHGAGARSVPPLAVARRGLVRCWPAGVSVRQRAAVSRADRCAVEPAPHPGSRFSPVWSLRGRRVAPGWAAPAALARAGHSGFGDWLGLEQAAHRAAGRADVRLAPPPPRFDDRVLDRAVAAAGRGRRLRPLVGSTSWSAVVDGAVARGRRRPRALGRLARRPQTGQLHQYLAQAVAAFTVLAVVARPREVSPPC